ncbi:MAG: magnesium/cobalt transporter CorA [Planctomycetota bacterium]|jgi:magnesium transporter
MAEPPNEVATSPGRRRRRRAHRHPPGTSPGLLVAAPDAERSTLQYTHFNSERVEERAATRLKKGAEVPADWAEPAAGVLWINVNGLADTELIAALGQRFRLHALALEDVLATHQRAKVERYGHHLYIVLRMVDLHPGTPDTEQLSLFLGPRFVLTFQERPGDCFEPIRKRIRTAGSRLRLSGPGFLAYALLDAVVDAYFPRLESFSDTLEALEGLVLDQPSPTLLATIHREKRRLQTFRRAAWPLREVVSQLLREEEEELVGRGTQMFMRDCYDHVIQVIDLVDANRDIASGLTDLYLSSLSNRMNEIMQVLTVIATIFIPLTFIAGIYGMNFDSMPELHWRFGYFACLAAMGTVGAFMFYFFYRQGWLNALRLAPRRDADRSPESPEAAE